MKKIAFLGTGAMGSRMIAHLVDAGHEVTVWNRTVERATRIEGVSIAQTPAEAASGADVVMAMVRDDEASAQVWLDATQGALGVMHEGAIMVESSTLTLGHVRELARQATAQGVHFYDAPVAGTLPQAEAAKLIYFVGGDEKIYRERLSPILDEMGGAQHYCGAQGRGAAMKLVVNALFASQAVVMAELLGVFGAVDFAVSDALDILGKTPVCSPAAEGISRAMHAGMFAPMFPIVLVEKDLRYALEAIGGESMMIAQVQHAFALACERGFGGDHITGVYKLFSHGD